MKVVLIIVIIVKKVLNGSIFKTIFFIQMTRLFWDRRSTWQWLFIIDKC